MNHLTTCSPPVPRPVPFGNRRSTCSLSPSLRGQEQVRPVPRPVPQGGDSTTTHPITHHRKDAPMSTDDRTETITERAAIRDSDEPDEFSRTDAGVAYDSDATVAALRAARDECERQFQEQVAARTAAEVEVQRLRAKVAAVEAVADALTTAAKIERGHGLAYAGGLIEAVQADLRAALATGEGK